MYFKTLNFRCVRSAYQKFKVLKYVQIIKFHDDQEPICHLSVTAIEMVIKNEYLQMFCFLLVAQAVKARPSSGAAALHT